MALKLGRRWKGVAIGPQLPAKTLQLATSTPFEKFPPYPRHVDRSKSTDDFIIAAIHVSSASRFGDDRRIDRNYSQRIYDCLFLESFA